MGEDSSGTVQRQHADSEVGWHCEVTETPWAVGVLRLRQHTLRLCGFYGGSSLCCRETRKHIQASRSCREWGTVTNRSSRSSSFLRFVSLRICRNVSYFPSLPYPNHPGSCFTSLQDDPPLFLVNSMCILTRAQSINLVLKQIPISWSTLWQPIRSKCEQAAPRWSQQNCISWLFQLVDHSLLSRI